jgi:hypothetical protein
MLHLALRIFSMVFVEEMSEALFALFLFANIRQVREFPGK